TQNVAAMTLTALLFAILGALAYLAATAGLSWRSWSVASIGSFLQSRLGEVIAGTPVTPPPLRAAAELRVVQFSAVPDRVAPGESVWLCYEVVNGTRVRIDPEIGEVGVFQRNCVSAIPMETTTYTLTADGTGGESVRQKALVQVDIAASRESQAEEVRAVNLGSELEATAGDPPLTPPTRPAPVTDSASILIFTVRPGSIAETGPTALCYAVSGASKVRIEPGIGEVEPTTTLTCRRVAPLRTTTYELTAYGRDGHYARQQVVIVVR